MTREPLFTQTVQIGIVVRDLEATMRRYVDDYGIGPWEIHEFGPDEQYKLYEHGRSVKRAWRLATTMIGDVQWELIQPLDDEGEYARFLAEKGEGVHHVALTPRDFDEAVEGKDLSLRGEFSGYQVAYLATESELGVVIETYKEP